MPQTYPFTINSVDAIAIWGLLLLLASNCAMHFFDVMQSSIPVTCLHAYLDGHLKELNVSTFPPGAKWRIQDYCVSRQAAHQLVGTLQMDLQEIYLDSAVVIRGACVSSWCLTAEDARTQTQHRSSRLFIIMINQNLVPKAKVNKMLMMHFARHCCVDFIVH